MDEIVPILRVNTDQAVQSVGDLRENIRLLNAQLNATTDEEAQAAGATKKLEIGTEEYQKTVQELTVNQNALRNAMNGTTATMDDVTKAARGVGTTYNSLVAQMKTLKQQIRNVDVSTEEGQQEFARLAVQIDDVNNRLKAMDADMGNYQRNVGNYKSALDNFGQVVSNMPPMVGGVKTAADNLDKSFKLLSTNPVMAVITLLLPLLMKLAGALGENEKVTAALQKVMKGLEPVMNMLEGLFEKIADAVASLVDWFADLAAESGDTFKNIVSAVVGVGNTIVQYMLTPVRAAINAFKALGGVIKNIQEGNWKAVKEQAADAWDGIKDAFSKGFSFKENFERGKEIGEQFLAGLESNKKKAKKAGTGIGKEVADGIQAGVSEEIEVLEDELDHYWDNLKRAQEANKERLAMNQRAAEDAAKMRLKWNALMTEDENERAAKEYEITRAANQAKLDALRQFIEDSEAIEDYGAAANAYREARLLEVQMEQDAYAEKKRIREKDAKDAADKAKQRVAVMQASASAVSGLLGSIADAYEDQAEADEKAAQKVKALRIVTGIIDTISGALTAFTSAMQLGPIAGPIVGAINAAAVTAAGVYQIAKIRSTKVGTGDTSDAGAGSLSVPSMSAPSTPVSLPEVRNVTSATEEDRLNRMASPQRVYILNSDLEANADYHEAQVAEATF